MTETGFAVLALLVLVWAVGSGLLLRANITGPMVFTVVGYALGNADWGPLSVNVNTPLIHVGAEITLALLLFSDAARVNLARLRREVALPGRLLGIGLPLTLVLGSVLAASMFGELSWALAIFVGATLAPTDAALSAQVVNDRRIQIRLRQTLNVESGLNDGIATPIVVFTLAVAASQLGNSGHEGPTEASALLELSIGVGVGIAVGLVSAGLISRGSRRGWIARGGRRLATLAAALASFTGAVALSGNGFVAAFIAGIAFGTGLDKEAAVLDDAVELPELLGEGLTLAIWFVFGAALVPVALHHLELSTLLYAVLSLTVVRIGPVALALAGAGLGRRDIAFIGWFGPRGLASIVFVLLAIEELGASPAAEKVAAIVALTVLLSVVLHGVSAGPLGRLYVRREGGEASIGEQPISRRTVQS